MSDVGFQGLSFHGDLLRALLTMPEPPLPERSEHQGEATANSDHEHQGCEEVKDDTVILHAVSSS